MLVLFRAVCFLMVAAAVGVTSLPATAQEWTRFRGPNGTGGSEATTIPTEFSAADFNWNVELPGKGHAQPVVWGNKLFITTAVEEDATRLVLCLDAKDGSTIWEKSYASSPHEKHLRNSYASSTPTVDEERVYVCWSAPDEYTFMALDHDGNEVWKLNLGPYVSQHSCGTSPIIYKDLAILGNDQDGDSFLLAVDRKTGKQRWRIERKIENVAYSTPCIFQQEGQPDQLIFNSGAHGVSSHDPLTGATLWELDVLDKRSVSSPVIAGGLIFSSCGSGAGGNYVAAVRPGAAPEMAYRIDQSAPYVPTPIVYRDLIFFWSDKGVVTCADAATGEVHWRERVGGNFSGSPIRVQDRLYCMSEDGNVVVLAAAKDYNLLAKNALGEGSHSTPTVAGGRIYFRTFSRLISVGG